MENSAAAGHGSTGTGFGIGTGFIDTSIVMATCSRAALLRGALASLVHQSWDDAHPLEIIVVDDASTDDTAAILAEFQRTSPIPFIVLEGTGEGVAVARNLACRRARGTWLASFDDDQVASPTWLGELRSFADITGAACVGGALSLQLPPGTSIDSLGPRVRAVLGEHFLADTPLPYGRKPLPATNNVLIRRDVFDAFEGFKTSFMEGGEDTDFFERVAAAGHQLWFQPASRAEHVTPPLRLTRANLRWTSLRLGASDARIDQHRHAFFGPLGHAVVRLAVAVFRDFPQLALSSIRRDSRALLDVQCSLWYTQGLLRALVPVLTSTSERSAFLRSMDFRSRNGERPTPTSRPATFR